MRDVVMVRTPAASVTQKVGVPQVALTDNDVLAGIAEALVYVIRMMSAWQTWSRIFPGFNVTVTPVASIAKPAPLGGGVVQATWPDPPVPAWPLVPALLPPRPPVPAAPDVPAALPPRPALPVAPPTPVVPAAPLVPAVPPRPPSPETPAPPLVPAVPVVPAPPNVPAPPVVPAAPVVPAPPLVPLLPGLPPLGPDWQAAATRAAVRSAESAVDNLAVMPTYCRRRPVLQ